MIKTNITQWIKSFLKIFSQKDKTQQCQKLLIFPNQQLLKALKIFNSLNLVKYLLINL